MSFDSIMNTYRWGIIALIVVIVLFVLAFFLSKKKKAKKTLVGSNKNINNLINDIRSELRTEHKRITVLFKDLDDFIAQLPAYMDTKEFKKLNDYPNDN